MKRLLPLLALALATLPAAAQVAPTFNPAVVLTAASVTASGSKLVGLGGATEAWLVVNVATSPTGTAPTLTFTVQEVDYGDGATVIGNATAGAALNATGTQLLYVSAPHSNLVKVSWVIGGSASPTFPSVYATLTSKPSGLSVQGLGTQVFANDAVTTVVQIKATAGQLFSLSLTNTTAATAYLQVFCKPSASVTLGTTPPDFFVRLKTNAGAGDERDTPFPGGTCANGTGLSVAGTTTFNGSTGAAVSVMATYQ